MTIKLIVRVAFRLWRLRRKCGGRIVRSNRSNIRRIVCAAEIATVRYLAEHHLPC